MAEPGSRTPASVVTAMKNALDIARTPGTPGGMAYAKNVTEALRQELRMKGLAGFKAGGKVKTKQGIVHKGEFVVKKSAAKAIGTKKLNTLNRAASPTPQSRGAKRGR